MIRKQFLFLAICVLTLGSLLAKQMPNTPKCQTSFAHSDSSKVTIILHLDEALSQVDQWVYLTSFCSWYSGAEQNIWDSCRVHSGQTRVELHAQLPVKTESRFSIHFAKEGPGTLGIYAQPDDSVEMEVKYTDNSKRTIYKYALRGKMNNDCAAFHEQSSRQMIRRNQLLARDEKDSLADWDRQILGFYRAEMEKTPYLQIASLCRAMFFIKGLFTYELPKDSLDAITQLVARRFPDWPQLKEGRDMNARSERGLWAEKRIKEIERERADYQAGKQDKQVGDVLNNLSLCDTEGKRIALSDLTDCQYIYVDVWASWCAPCRAQFPRVKEALDKYPQSLKVYAISIDNNHESWQRAIVKEELQAFINVTGTDDKWNQLKEVTDLGVTRIPRSFLLDRNRRIVAKDLHDGQLIQTLDSLLASPR